jgi:hypothetical protein
MIPRSFCLRFTLALGLLALQSKTPAWAETIEIASKPVPLNPTNLKQDKVGLLTYRGGLVLTSSHPRFGGLSSLRLSEEGARVTFVSDEGSWLTAHIVHDEQGNLLGLSDAEIGTLLDLDGKALVEKEKADAESLVRMPDGSMIVGFEHHHRLWRYAASNGRLDARPTVVPSPPGLEGAPANGGIEALVVREKGDLFALTEYWIVDEMVRGWANGPERWQTLGYRFEGAFRPSDMARLPSGDVVVVERAYNPDRGIVGVRLRRVRGKDVKGGAKVRSTPIAELAPPLSVDNFEGIDAVRGKKGETLIYLVSDNNFRAGDQRTLLLMFSFDQR